MIRELACAAAIAGAALTPAVVAAQDPPAAELAFVVDPRLGMDAGVTTMESVRRLVVWTAAALPSPFPIDEKGPGGRVLGVGLRAVELAFVDVPLLEADMFMIHEVFGHGARAREYGASASYSFSVPRPYRWFVDPDNPDSFSARTHVETIPHHPDHDLLVHAGGIEANALTARRVSTEIVRRRGVAQRTDLLVYAVSKLVYVPGFLSPDLGGPGGGDLTNYVAGLQDRFNRWRPEQGNAIAERLRIAYVYNLADPLLLYSLYATFVPWLGRGETWMRAPLPEVGGVVVMPMPRFNLSPFGAEHGIGIAIADDGWIVEPHARVGSSGLASYVGAGVAAEGLRPTEWLEIGAELDGWRQPEVLVEERNVYERDRVVGGSAALRASWMFTDRYGVTGKLGVKSRGYLQGQPLDAGAYGFAGFAVRLPDARR